MIVKMKNKFAWRTTTIGEICNVVGGGTPSTKESSYFGGDIPWITPKDLSGEHDRYIKRGNRNISEHGLDKSSARMLPTDTVLLSTRAPIGYVAIAANPLTTNQGFRSLVVKPGTSPEFLYYWLKSNTLELKRHASGSTFGELSGTSLKQIPISLPSLEEQCRIARILGTLDDKIELNRRMNATLEGMARALFKSWFLDFEPVRAKMDGRWRSGESLSGMPAELYDLFPKRLVPSELGEVPEGWEIRSMGDISDVVGGSTPRTSEVSYWENGTNFFATPKDLSFLSVPVLLKSERQITDAGVARISSGSLPVGTVLLSSRAPIGYLAITEIPVSVNQGFIAMKPKSDISNLFLLYLTRSLHDEIVSRANGTTYLEISKRNFRPIPVVTPPPTTMSAFHRMAKQFYDRIVMNEKEKSTLFGLRECLLPKLVLGQVPLSQDTDLIATR